MKFPSSPNNESSSSPSAAKAKLGELVSVALGAAAVRAEGAREARENAGFANGVVEVAELLPCFPDADFRSLILLVLNAWLHFSRATWRGWKG